MGSLKTLVLAGVVAGATSSAALAADLLPPPPPMMPPPPLPHAEIGSGWYLRGDVGVGISGSSTPEIIDTTNSPGLVFQTDDLGDTAFVGLGVGYQVNNWLRFDLTGEYRAAAHFSAQDRDTFFANAWNVQTQTNEMTTWGINNIYRGQISAFVALANAYVELGTWNCLTPFLGVGVGVAQVHFSPMSDTGVVGPLNTATYLGFGPSGPGHADAKSSTNFAWALHAGVAYTINPNLKLELGYRYLNIGKAESGDIINSFTLANTRNNFLRVKDIESHDIKLGMRWTFGDPNCCTTTPPPVMYDAPIVAKN